MILLNLVLYKIYLHRKILEEKKHSYFKNVNGFKEEYTIYNLEQFIYLRIEKLLEKQIDLLKQKPDKIENKN